MPKQGRRLQCSLATQSSKPAQMDSLPNSAKSITFTATSEPSGISALYTVPDVPDPSPSDPPFSWWGLLF